MRVDILANVPLGILNDAVSGRGLFVTKILIDSTLSSSVLIVIGTAEPFSESFGILKVTFLDSINVVEPNKLKIAVSSSLVLNALLAQVAQEYTGVSKVKQAVELIVNKRMNFLRDIAMLFLFLLKYYEKKQLSLLRGLSVC